MELPRPMTSGPIDGVVCTSVVAVVAFIVAAYLPRRWLMYHVAERKETYFAGVVHTLLYANVFIAGMMVTGIVGMYLRVATGWWLLFQMLWLASIGCVFLSFPIMLIPVLAWCVYGRWCLGYTSQALAVTLGLVVTLGLNVVLMILFGS